MKDYLNIGPVPNSETCFQVGKHPPEDIMAQCHIFKRQLIRQFPEATEMFKVKKFDHDFGTYYEVCVIYDDENEKETQIVYKIDCNCPDNWDNEAKKENNKLILS